jgi:hypothetical protein
VGRHNLPPIPSARPARRRLLGVVALCCAAVGGFELGAIQEGSAAAATSSGIFVDGAACWPSAGAANAAYRYIDCGNGTILDTVAGLLVLQDANCLEMPPPLPLPGDRSWWDAAAVAAGLQHGDCGLSDHSQPGDWRLPTLVEWEVMIARAVALGCTSSGGGNPPSLTNDPGTHCLNLGPSSFVDVQVDTYWSVSSRAADPTEVWAADLGKGLIVADSQPTLNYVLPVRETE